MLRTIARELLYRPIANALTGFYLVLPLQDFGLAIAALTVCIRLLMVPMMLRSMRAQEKIAAIQPKVEEIKKRFKNSKEEQARKMTELFREHRVNPLSSFLYMFLQIAVLITLFFVIRDVSGNHITNLYSFIRFDERINTMMFGILDLAKPNIFLGVLAGIIQFILSYLSLKKRPPQKSGGDLAHSMQKQMTYFAPVMTVLVSASLPSALALYWVTSSLFSLAQHFITRSAYPVM